MTDTLEQLVDSLLFEGYALYPYTPGATKNATPTPFGIAYPPAYAQTLTSTFDHLELRGSLQASADALLHAEVRFLAPGTDGHQAAEQRLTLPGGMVGALAHSPARKQARIRVGGGDSDALIVAMTLDAQPIGVHLYEVTLRVENRTQVPGGLTRGAALAHSLLSTHPILQVVGGRFLSPLERPYDSVNTFPVLASPDDDALIGATIVLPDHPQIAPESHGSLFDSTEIEEALLLHVQVLSDQERAEIEEHDPAVREMIRRAAAATPEDMRALHGRVMLRDPETNEPPSPPPGLLDPTAGEESAEVDGQSFRRGAKVLLRLGPDADLHARMMEGRVATIERIMTAYDGRTHLGVTIDGDPGQDLMRDTGRLLYFFPPEVEVVDG